VQLNNFADRGNINEAISHAYLWLLSETEDTFVKMAFGAKMSRYVKERAKAIVTGGYKLNEIKDIAILGGLRF
jgi:triphosphoribosyl-dephospho-CoA synthetase